MFDINRLSSKKLTARAIERTGYYQEQPLDVFQTLVENNQESVLLESADVTSKDRLKSILIIDAALKITCNDLTISVVSLSNNGDNLLKSLCDYLVDYLSEATEKTARFEFTRADANLDEEKRLLHKTVFEPLRFFLNAITIEDGEEPIMVAGVFAYDLIGNIERLPQVDTDFNDCPDYIFYVSETQIIIDHQHKTTKIISHIFPNNGHIENNATVDNRNLYIQEICQQDIHYNRSIKSIDCVEESNVSDPDFSDTVKRLKDNIIAGDVFQVVPSRAFYVPCYNTFNAYYMLKITNPSPYMFYLKTSDFVLFGASPESALKYQASNRVIEVYPIAGTRPRGKTQSGELNSDLDSRIELELRQDNKELAEHMMLVDLARNDVARISEPGTRCVPELLKVDRYSHVMHLVSRVTGTLNLDLDTLHAYQACMNMGTLVGAPKIRAAELIRIVENKRRGSYGGAVGYFDSNGNMDTCIVIRSAFVKNNIACIQAGAGVVFDSDPQSETDETRHKAQAVINAIKTGGGV